MGLPGHVRPLVVVRDLDIVGITSLPSEADPPLIVDSDAALSGPVTREALKAVPGRNPKVLYRLCGIQEQQLAMSPPLHVRRKSPRPLAFEDLLGFPVTEAPNHPLYITQSVINVKRYGARSNKRLQLTAAPGAVPDRGRLGGIIRAPQRGCVRN